MQHSLCKDTDTSARRDQKKSEVLKRNDWQGGKFKECKNLSGPIYSLCRLHRSPQIKHGLLAHLVSQWVMPARWSWTVLWGARTKKRKNYKEKKVSLTCSLLAMFVVGKSRPIYANVPTGGASFSICLRLILFQLLPNSNSSRLQRQLSVIMSPKRRHCRTWTRVRICKHELQIKLLAQRLRETDQPTQYTRHSITRQWLSSLTFNSLIIFGKMENNWLAQTTDYIACWIQNVH